MEKILKNYENAFENYSVEQLTMVKKWLEDYMVPVNEEKIVWLNLTGEELLQFLKENYIDDNKQVMWHISWLPTALGMRYINFLHIAGFNYLIGVIPNKVAKKTIVASLCYQKDRILSVNQEKPVNYIQTIEVNAFYQRKGLFMLLASKIKDLLNLEQDLVITDEADDGIEFHTVERITNVLREQGYDGEVFTRQEFNQRCRKSK